MRLHHTPRLHASYATTHMPRHHIAPTALRSKPSKHFPVPKFHIETVFVVNEHGLHFYGGWCTNDETVCVGYFSRGVLILGSRKGKIVVADGQSFSALDLAKTRESPSSRCVSLAATTNQSSICSLATNRV